MVSETRARPVPARLASSVGVPGGDASAPAGDASAPAGDASAPAGDGARPRRPRWIPLAAMLAVVALCVTAGNWQRGRLHEKEALRAALERADQDAPRAFPTGVGDWSAWRFRRVLARGRYESDRQFLVDNRVRDGRVGYEVVTPLALADGARLLVDRGFVYAAPDRAVLPDLPPPPGEVEVAGRVAVAPRGYVFGNPPPRGALWAHLDVERYARDVDPRALPVYLQASGGVADPGLTRDWPVPDLGTQMHLGYMVQWYSFAALAAGLWIAFAVRRRSHR